MRYRGLTAAALLGLGVLLGQVIDGTTPALGQGPLGEDDEEARFVVVPANISVDAPSNRGIRELETAFLVDTVLGDTWRYTERYDANDTVVREWQPIRRPEQD